MGLSCFAGPSGSIRECVRLAYQTHIIVAAGKFLYYFPAPDLKKDLKPEQMYRSFGRKARADLQNLMKPGIIDGRGSTTNPRIDMDMCFPPVQRGSWCLQRRLEVLTPLILRESETAEKGLFPRILDILVRVGTEFRNQNLDLPEEKDRREENCSNFLASKNNIKLVATNDTISTRSDASQAQDILCASDQHQCSPGPTYAVQSNDSYPQPGGNGAVVSLRTGSFGDNTHTQIADGEI